MANDMLRVEELVVSFDGFVVLDHTNLAVAERELRFLIGPNGAGKTTLMDVMSGKIRPESGKVTFNGTLDVTKCGEDELVRRGIGRKFQTPSVYGSLTCFENLEVAIGFRSNVLALFGRLSGGQRDRIAAVLERVGLQERGRVSAKELSHGERQWLEIAMLLVQNPKLLLLDEPVAGMTKRERARTGEILHELKRDHTIIITEHDMEFVREFAETVTVLHQGSVIKEGTVREVQGDPLVLEVYLGRSLAAAGVEG